MARNATTMTPMDFWFPSNPNIKPQKAHQIAGGYSRNFFDNEIETSIEVYYKFLNDAIDFKDHANLLLNPLFDGELRFGNAYSYGLEFLVRKQTGKLTGFVAYTLSKTRKIIESINDGDPYPPVYDKPHNISCSFSYDITNSISASMNWVYSSPKPVTAPVGKYNYWGETVPIYSERNGQRIPGTEYHRLDLSTSFKSSATVFGREINGELVLSAYNVYARHNMYSIRYAQKDNNGNKTVAKKLYLFTIIPSITFNFEF